MINLLLLACCHPDSAAQAVIASMLDTLLPNDPIVGEEDAQSCGNQRIRNFYIILLPW